MTGIEYTVKIEELNGSPSSVKITISNPFSQDTIIRLSKKQLIALRNSLNNSNLVDLYYSDLSPKTNTGE